MGTDFGIWLGLNIWFRWSDIFLGTDVGIWLETILLLAEVDSVSGADSNCS